MADEIELVKFTADATDLEKVAEQMLKTRNRVNAATESIVKVTEKAFGRGGKQAAAFKTVIDTIDKLGVRYRYVFTRNGQQVIGSAKLESVAADVISNANKKKIAALVRYTLAMEKNAAAARKAVNAQLTLEERAEVETIRRLKREEAARKKAIEAQYKQEEKAAVETISRLNKEERDRKKALDRQEQNRRAAQNRFLRELAAREEATKRAIERQFRLEEKAEVERISRERREAGQAKANKLTQGFVGSLGGVGPRATEQGLLNLATAQKQVETVLAKGKVSEATLRHLFDSIRANSATAFQNLTADEREAEIAIRRLVAAMKTLDTAGKRSQEIMISWQGAVRLLAVQQLHRMIGTVTNALGDSITKAQQFSVKIAEIQTISQSAQRSTDAWSSSLLKLSNEFGVDLLDATAAAYEAISNQMGQGAAVTPFLVDAFKFARTTASSAEQSINLLSSALNAYGKSTIHTAEVSAGLFKLIDLGRVTAGELANTYGNTATLANSLGVSMNELNAGIATLSITGVRADTSMTLMNNIFLKLIKPTKEMSSLFQEWGVESGEAAIQTFGFIGVLQRLENEVQKGGTNRLGELVSDMRAIRATAALTGGSAFAGYNNALQKMIKSSTEFDKAVKITEQSIGFRYQKQIVQLQNALIETFGSNMVRILTEFAEAVGGAGNGMDVLFTGVANTIEIATDSFGALVQMLGTTAGGFESLSSLIPAVTYSLVAMGLSTKAVTGALYSMYVALTLMSPVTLAIGAAVAVLTFDWAQHLNSLKKISSAIVDVENELADSNTKYSNRVSNNLARETDDFAKNLRERLKIINQMAAVFRQGSTQSIIPVSEQQQGINDRRGARAEAGADPLQKLTLMTARMKEMKADADKLVVAKQFEDAENAMKEVLKLSGDINDEITSMISKAKDEIISLTDRRNSDAFDNSLLGLGDTAKSKKIEEEIKRLVSLSDELLNAGKLEASNRELDKAYGLSQRLIDSQVAAKEELGLKPKNLSGFSLQDQITERQIKLQEELITKAEQASINEQEMYDKNLKHLEAMTSAVNTFNENLIQTNSLVAELETRLAASAKAVSESTAQSRGKASNAAGSVDQYLESLGNSKAYGIYFKTDNMEEINALADANRNLKDSLAAGASDAIIQENLNATYEAYYKIWQITDAIAKQRGSRNNVVGNNGETPFSIGEGVATSMTGAIQGFVQLGRTTAEYAQITANLSVATANLNKQSEELRNFVKTSYPEAYAKAASLLTPSVQTMVQLMDSLNASAQGVKSSIQTLQNGGAPPSRATGGLNYSPGGMIGGPGGRDNQTFNAHRGEFVMNAEATKRFTPQLTAMNSAYTNSITNSRQSTVNVGDVHVHANVSGGKIDAAAVGAQLRRAIRMGNAKLN